MGLLFGRIKNWIKNETIKASDLNAEFNNILNNTSLPEISGYSSNVSQMQIQTNPGSEGSENLAQTTADEITELRFVISRIIGGSFWYDTPSVNLDQIPTLLASTAPPNNRIVSGLKRASSNQPAFLVAAGGSSLNVTLKGSVTPFIYYVAGTQCTISTDVSLGITAGPATATAVVNDSTLSGAIGTKTQGEGTSVITYGSPTAAWTSSATAGTYQAFSLTHTGTEYFLAFVNSSTQLTKSFRGFYFDSTSAPVIRLGMSNSDALTFLRLTWIFATTAGALDSCATNPKIAFTAPTSPFAGDFWFDLTNNIWKKYNGSTFVAANSTLIGQALTTTTACVATRSFEFYAPYQALNTSQLEIQDNSTVRTTQSGVEVSVAGNTLRYDHDIIRWTKPTNLDSGVSDTASANYFLYLKDTGDVVISDVVPYDRTADLRGYYHPYNPWREVGMVTNDGSSNYVTIVQEGILPATLGSIVGIGGVAISAESGIAAAGNSTTFANIATTGLPITVATTGRPVFISLASFGNSFVQVSDTTTNNIAVTIQLTRTNTAGSSTFSMGQLGIDGTKDSGTNVISVIGSPGQFTFIDQPNAGLWTYTVQYKVASTSGAANFTLNHVILVAYEILRGR